MAVQYKRFKHGEFGAYDWISHESAVKDICRLKSAKEIRAKIGLMLKASNDAREDFRSEMHPDSIMSNKEVMYDESIKDEIYWRTYAQETLAQQANFDAQKYHALKRSVKELMD